MPSSAPEAPPEEQMVQLLTAEGTFQPSASAEAYLPYVEKLADEDHQRFYRDMVVVRRFDSEAANLQRNGQLALWPPSSGQEAAQVGSGHAAKPQDHIFPSYREHAVAMIRGVDLLRLIEMMRGNSHGGWNPSEHGNFHLYSVVIGTQTLHATGYAMAMQLDGATNTANPDTDEAVLVYFGDGASSQGDVSEALVFAASYQSPQVFFLQNNHWAISVPVTRQSRTPLYRRADGFGMPGVRVDGNDVLASYAVTAKLLDDARAGQGPALVEALTYRVGAHTTSDDPSKYRTASELESWIARDPIARMRTWLEGRGASAAFFAGVEDEAADFAADIRRRTVALGPPPTAKMFDHVYAEPHPMMAEQSAWLSAYEASFVSGE
ncbi:pyruvate dehydrogenase (acetyl-transferring) E1 component subunit alpha [Homoserinimonas sp. OAct 916]|uniref:pyruvate dehydrogenase (acetyl-transferring) E1 component subunit alpha n=1 Tax=Homoserinimonas sp. OAct 916 TaxID=2211450 RepID=UPI000DBE774A|nr:pyruvate dehydrogenase (acetyl-transferring) E1 component subunit alpha [Homoserinimonas sp. OAct 916]